MSEPIQVVVTRQTKETIPSDADAGELTQVLMESTSYSEEHFRNNFFKAGVAFALRCKSLIADNLDDVTQHDQFFVEYPNVIPQKDLIAFQDGINEGVKFLRAQGIAKNYSTRVLPSNKGEDFYCLSLAYISL